MAAIAPHQDPEITTDVENPVQHVSDGGDDISIRAAKRQKRSTRSSPTAHQDDPAIVGSRSSNRNAPTAPVPLEGECAVEVISVAVEPQPDASTDTNDQKLPTGDLADVYTHDPQVDRGDVSKSPSNQEQDESNDEDYAPKPAAKKRAKLVVKDGKKPAPPRKSRSKYDDPLEMLTNQRSPLGTAMLRDLLCDPRAWDVLTREEKQRVLGEFPDQSEILDPDTADARPNIALLRNNNNFRHDISRYQEDLREGRHDPEWITQAQAAHRKRELGVYDEFLANKFQEDWGVPMHEVEVNSKEEPTTKDGSPSVKDTSNDVRCGKEDKGANALPEGPAQAATALDDGGRLTEDAGGDSTIFVGTQKDEDGQTSTRPADGGTIKLAETPVADEENMLAKVDS